MAALILSGGEAAHHEVGEQPALAGEHEAAVHAREQPFLGQLLGAVSGSAASRVGVDEPGAQADFAASAARNAGRRPRALRGRRPDSEPDASRAA